MFTNTSISTSMLGHRSDGRRHPCVTLVSPLCHSCVTLASLLCHPSVTQVSSVDMNKSRTSFDLENVIYRLRWL